MRDDNAQCAGQMLVGYAPISYFILGCLEVLICASLGIMIFKRNFIPSLNEATRINFLLPVYLTVVLFLVSLGILMGVDRIVGYYGYSTDVFITVCRWFILRACTEALSIFFRYAGIGLDAVKYSILIGIVWSLFNSIVLLSAFAVFGFQVFVFLCLVVALSLALYYGAMWLAPYKVIHRRPAAASFAMLNMLMIIVQIAVIISYLGGDQQSNSNCAVEFTFSLLEFVQLGIMLTAFLVDSMFWQGMVSLFPLLNASTFVWFMYSPPHPSPTSCSIIRDDRPILRRAHESELAYAGDVGHAGSQHSANGGRFHPTTGEKSSVHYSI
jgi:hypothetical protein